MKLGLITDVHEHVEPLRAALDHLRQERVDQLIVIGDILEMGLHLAETCQLLRNANVIGVWGNHDFGFCVDPPEEHRQKYPSVVFDYLATLRPRLEFEGCLFTHVEPWLNPESMFDLWYFDGPPDEPYKLDRIFQAVPNRVMFAGHFHQWLLATPTGISPWCGSVPIRLDAGRYFVVINALCDGHYAVYDTDTCILTPHQVAGGRVG